MQFSCSIVIPVHNNEESLPQTVNSALSTGIQNEIILADDNSSDGSWQYCISASKAHRNIKCIQSSKTSTIGAGACRNLAIQHSSKEWIAFLDADDGFFEHRFKETSSILAENPEIDGIYEPVKVKFDHETSKTRYQELGGAEDIFISPPCTSETLFHNLVKEKQSSVHTNGVCLRKTLIDEVGGFCESLPLTQDIDMWIKAAALGNIIPSTDQQAVAYYQIHENNRAWKNPEDLYYFGTKRAAELLRWSLEKNLSQTKQNLLLEYFHDYWEAWFDELQKSEKSITLWKWRKVYAWISSRPIDLKKAEFWKRFVWSVGLHPKSRTRKISSP